MVRVSLTLVALAIGGANAFAPQSPRTFLAPKASALYANTQTSPPTVTTADERSSYAEVSRSYRRTVFTHDDWVRHRSSDRFLRNLGNYFNSGVYKNIIREVGVATGIATFVVLTNLLVGEYTDLEGVKQAGLLAGNGIGKLGLPLTPFTLASPSLGLLLVFRTNTSYQRWDEARKNWGSNINRTRDLVRMGTAFYDSEGVAPEKRQEDLKRLSLCTWAFVRAMKRHLSPEWEDEEAFKAELYERLPKEQADAIISAAHRPNRALFDLSLAIENLPMHYLRKNQMHMSLTQFEDNLGSSERLLTSPVPLFYSRHLGRFLSLWMFALPFGLYGTFENSYNGVGLIPTVGLLSVFLFGIEELSAQMEEPFTILPMQGFCDKIGNWCNEIVSWSPGDNGMPINEPYAKHVAVYDTEIEMADVAVNGTTDKKGFRNSVKSIIFN